MPGEEFIPDGQFVPDSPPAGEAKPVSHAPADMQPKAPAQEATPDFIPEEQFQSDEDKFGTPGQMALGLAEKFGQGLAGPIPPAIERATGLTTPEAMRGRAEQLGGLGTAAELVGFGTGAVLGTGEAAVLSKLGAGAAKLAGLGQASTLGAKVAAGAIKGAAEMSALQGGDEITKLIEKDPNQTATSAAINIGLSGLLLGPTMGASMVAVPALWSATAGPQVEKILGKIKADWGFGNPVEGEEHIVSPQLKSVLSTLFNVPKEQMEEYALNREAIRSAPEFMDLYGHVLDELGDISDNLATKKATVEGSKARFADFLEKQKLALKQAGYDAGASNTMAQEALKQAQLRVAQGIQQEAVDAAPKVFSAVQKLKTQALEMSQGSMEILEKEPGELSLKPVFAAVRPMQDKLYALGFPGHAEELGKVMDVFANQYGDKISYPDAKTMIQGLQQRGKWNFGANEVSNGLSSYFSRLSGIMNEHLKDAVPAYRRAMAPTAESFQLLDKLDKYATPESSVKGVLGLNKIANYTNEMPVLRDLEKKSGINFVDSLENFSNPEIKQKMVSALPEYKEAARAAEALQQLKDPETRAAMERSPYLSKAHQDMIGAEQSLEAAAERNQKYRGLTPATIEGKLKAVGAGKNIQAKAALSQLRGFPGFEDMTIPEVMNLIHLKESFEKGAINGSRNVNLWAKMSGTLGGLIGALIGHNVEGTAIGAGAGAAVGAHIDKNGPAIVRDLLDKYLDKYGDLPKMVGGSRQATTGALVKFLESGKPANGPAFKSTVDYFGAARKGADLLGKAAKGIFEGGKVLPKELYPNKEDIDKLKERTKKLQTKPPQAFYNGGGVGDYMPEHGIALSQHAESATQFINMHRPEPKKVAFFDEPAEPTKDAEQEFDRGLKIAQQPLMIFHHIKEGTLLPQDVSTIQNLHPDYFQHMKSKLVEAMTNHVSEGGKVPYSIRQSLSLFLGQPVDSSLAPTNIMAAQATFVAQKQQQQAQVQPQGKAKASANPALSKMATPYRTQNEASQLRKQQSS